VPRTSIHKALGIAEEHYRAGRLVEAEKKCRAILLQNPNEPEALKLAAVLARRQGRIAEAMGIAAHAAQTHPDVAEIHAELGEVSRAAGMREQAVAAFERAVQLKPMEAAFHNRLASALFENRQFEKALAECDTVIGLKADDVDAWSNKGGVLRELGRLDEAATAMETALRLRPLLAPAHLNMALIRAGQGRFGEAMECSARAIAIKPDYAEAHYNLGMLHLLLGDMERGWREYQWRPTRKAPTGRPIWRGENLRGRTIGLFSEQGFGDTVQFARYVPMLEERGARVWLMCRRELARLLEPMIAVVRPGEALPEHDFCCPLLDLPGIFGTTLRDIPPPVAYLKTQTDRERSEKPRVGLVWAGSPGHRDDARRSMRFERLRPIVVVPDIEWVNLQVGPAAQQAEGSTLVGPGMALRDFADTRAVIETLDLLIAVDTAVVHLAGAMGKPVWTLLPFVPDWRWMLEREDSPWYPTMRLFRQAYNGDWDSVIRRVVDALSLWIKNRG
jgi:Flp pilus assembly protein TadD